MQLQNPFDDCPHPLALEAAKCLRNKLDESHLLSKELLAEGHGKMFGVLVVVDCSGKPGYLASFSGMLNGQWLVPGFVCTDSRRRAIWDPVRQAAITRQPTEIRPSYERGKNYAGGEHAFLITLFQNQSALCQ